MEAKKTINSTVVSPEDRLLDYILRINRFSRNRTVLHIHISALMANYRKDHNVRIAAHLFDTYLGRSEGELIQLKNGDFFFIANGIENSQLQRLVDRLRSLFGEDPLVSETMEGQSGFCSWYDVESQYAELLQDVKTIIARLQNQKETGKKDSLDSRTLVQLEHILSKADISSFIRNQAICQISDYGSIRPIIDEIYVSIEDLRMSVCPDHTLTGDKWLFQYITQLLDRRMLQNLMHNEYSLRERVVSINLNISTILSAEFLEFDSNLSAKSRDGRLVIEIQKHDIFSDMGAYMFAEQYLHERTHRLALDGITYQTLPFIDFERLNLDFIKLGWSPEILSKRDLITGPLKDHINRIGPEHFILMYCDSQEAMEFGRELGITRYQGRHVSSLLRR